jgi:transcriptional regulator with XRE-family HTH domain
MVKKRKVIAMFGWGTGKPKSRLGKWLAKNGYTIQDLSDVSKVNRNTLGKACSDKNYIPSPQTMKKILKAIRQIDPNAKYDDFWDM